MKYCPYCGASCIDDAVFCMGCGKNIPESQSQQTQTAPAAADAATTTQGKAKKPPELKRRKPRRQLDPLPSEPESEPARTVDPDTGYDGYYNDVLPPDHDREQKGTDRKLIKQIAWVGAGALVIIGLAILAMQLL